MKIRVHRRVFITLLVILAWFSFVIEGSFALLRDRATLTGNTISTKSVDLLISNSQNPTSALFAESSVGFSHTLVPGTLTTDYFHLKNVANDGVHFNIALQTVITPGFDHEMINSINLNIVPVDMEGNDIGPGVTGSLYALSLMESSIHNMITAGGSQRFRITTNLSLDYEGEENTVMYDLVFTGIQQRM